MSTTPDPMTPPQPPDAEMAQELIAAFVAGAKWHHWNETGFTMFPQERDDAEAEARNRYAPAADSSGATGGAK